jgi:hypothetical protein
VRRLGSLFVALALVCIACPASHASGSVPNVSPDGRWSVVYSRQNGYGRLDLVDRLSGRRYRMYRSNDSCCQEITWVSPHLLVFVDDYNVKTLDPSTRRVARISGFSDFVVSPNGRWVAGWASCGGHCAETVEVVPIGGGPCRAFPHRPDQDDSYPFFSPDSRKLTVLRRPFDPKRGELVGRSREVTLPLADLRRVRRC